MRKSKAVTLELTGGITYRSGMKRLQFSSNILPNLRGMVQAIRPHTYLPFPPRNLPVKFGTNPSTIFLVIVVTDRQTHKTTPVKTYSHALVERIITAFAGCKGMIHQQMIHTEIGRRFNIRPYVIWKYALRHRLLFLEQHISYSESQVYQQKSRNKCVQPPQAE